ncbi:hypothetical protein B0H15DRAFT_954490 [Mycena belliarum]|uniref:Uncharacterized protein n=1 Tax=Mycena belliarum TaxID=1033014 RepID=A0AAD6TXA8_9AGAR|nr:hypothetical protein B0H15DRAFT_954490 [Mycena belliae]
MARKVKASGEPPGRKSDFTGEKKEWLESFRPRLLEVAKNPSKTYDEITNLFILRYGYDLPWAENVVGSLEDQPPPPPTTDAEEVARRANIRATLRQKIPNWYRNRYRGKKVHAGTIKKILKTMEGMAAPTQRPRRKPGFAVYSTLHYAERVKPRFDAYWNSVKATEPASSRVSMSQAFVKRLWAEESPEFRAQVEAIAEEMHIAAMQEWREGQAESQHSAKDYHHALENFNAIGIPLADTCSQLLGAHVVIMVIGPVGSAGGEVLLRTVFSDTAGGATTKTWPEYDHKGFTAMEKSVTKYGRAFFTKEACAARAWPLHDPAEVDGMLPIDPPTGSSDGAATSGIVSALPSDPITPPVASSSGIVVEIPSDPITPPVASSSGVVVETPSNPMTATVASGSGGSDSAAVPRNPMTTPPATARAMEAPPTTMESPTMEETPSSVDQSGWSESLVGAYSYLSSKPWGPLWTQMIEKLVFFEWAHFHVEECDRRLIAPHGAAARPSEVAQWMKEHRRWVDQSLEEKAPNGPFGPRLLAWWKALGPKGRLTKSSEDGTPGRPGLNEDKADYSHIEWTRLRVYGKNGLVLVALMLAWWGQTIWNRGAVDGLGGGDAALAKSADWLLLVEDLTWVLGMLAEDQDRPGIEEVEREEVKETRHEKTAPGKGTKRKAAPSTGSAQGPPKRKARGKKAAAEPEMEPELVAPPRPRPQPRPLPKKSKTTSEPAVANTTGTTAPVETAASTVLPDLAPQAADHDATPLVLVLPPADPPASPMEVGSAPSVPARVTEVPFKEGLAAATADSLALSGEKMPASTATASTPLEDEDPFAGLSAEELEEMAMDPDADMDETGDED